MDAEKELLNLYAEFTSLEPHYIYFEEGNVDPLHYSDKNVALYNRLEEIALAMADLAAVTVAGLRAQADVARKMIHTDDPEESLPAFHPLIDAILIGLTEGRRGFW